MATTTLTARMFGRTETTEHPTDSDALARVAAICAAQTCRIENGQFIPRVNIAGCLVDDPSGAILGTYELSHHS